jgi:hypothetical protein
MTGVIIGLVIIAACLILAGYQVARMGNKRRAGKQQP